jgi:hypothetical protein
MPVEALRRFLDDFYTHIQVYQLSKTGILTLAACEKTDTLLRAEANREVERESASALCRKAESCVQVLLAGQLKHS